MQSSTRRSPEPIWLVLTVFVSTHLMMTWPAEGSCLYGDYVHSFGLGALSKTGSLPYIRYGSEYPPLSPFLNLVLHRLSRGVFKHYALLPSLTLLVFETGSLHVLCRLAGDLWDKDRAAQTIPLVLLSLSPGRAVLFALALGFVNILEWSVVLSRGLTELLPLTIAAPTFIFVPLSWGIYQQLTVNSRRMGMSTTPGPDGGWLVRREVGRGRAG